jgi:hypothetical protein
VFSFGVPLLEVACGRKPVDPSMDAEEILLVEWAWKLYTKGKLLEAVDSKLGEGYDVTEMERILKLGLLCSHPDQESRLSMRHICQILEGEAPPHDFRAAWINVISITGGSPSGIFSYSSHEFSQDRSSEIRSERRSESNSASRNSPSLELTSLLPDLCVKSVGLHIVNFVKVLKYVL